MVQIPQNLKLTLQNTDAEEYCGGTVILGQTTQPSSTQGDWNQFNIPLSNFGCTTPPLSQVTSCLIACWIDEDYDFAVSPQNLAHLFTHV